MRLSSISSLVHGNQSKHVHNSTQLYNEEHDPMENFFSSSISSLYFMPLFIKMVEFLMMFLF